MKNLTKKEIKEFIKWLRKKQDKLNREKPEDYPFIYVTTILKTTKGQYADIKTPYRVDLRNGSFYGGINIITGEDINEGRVW